MGTPAITATLSRQAWRVLLVCLVAAGCLVLSAQLVPAAFWYSAGIIGAIVLAALCIMATCALGIIGYCDETRASRSWILLARWGMVVTAFAIVVCFELAIFLMDEQKTTFSVAAFGIAGILATPPMAGALWGVLAPRAPSSDSDSC